jgi:tetratricopeptide (TPR) repeat protein
MLDARTNKLGTDHPDTLVSKNNLAWVYHLQGKHDQAEALYREAIEGARRKLGIAHPSTQMFVRNLVNCYEQRGQPAQAEPLLRELADFWKQKAGADSPQYAGELAGLGLNLLRQQKYAEAEPLLRDALAIRAKTQPDAWTSFNTRSLLGGSLLGQQKYAEAEPLLLQGYEGLKQRETKMPANAKVRLTEALERLVQLYDAWQKKDKADEWRKQLEAATKPPAKP